MRLSRQILKADIVLSLAFARALVVFVPFRFWRGLLGPFASDAPDDLPPLSPAKRKQAEDTGRMILRLARAVPFEAVCLPQAMTGRWVLGRRGIPSHLQIGSGRRPGDEGFTHHAWLMVEDLCVTGAAEREHYVAHRRSRA